MLDVFHNIKQVIASQIMNIKQKTNLRGIHSVNTIDRISMDKRHRTIMMIGETGTGKSTLLNSMMNYLWDVKHSDPYRFKLIYETLKAHGDAESVTDNVTAYHLSPPTLDYELTVIDTPGFGDTRGLAQDQKITKQIKKFFETKIQEIDAICFVIRAPQSRLTATQKYIFAQVLGIFGRDIADNILILMTFADGAKPPALAALKAEHVPFRQAFKFNNSAFDLHVYDHDEEDEDEDIFTEMFWKMGISSFREFFKALHELQTQSLRLTKKVLSTRAILYHHLKCMDPYIRNGFAILEKLRKHIVEITKYENVMSTNKNYMYTIMVEKARRIPNHGSWYTTTCLQCNFSCHQRCPYSDNADKARCSVMDSNGYCRQCPSRCHWSLHKNQAYTVERYKEEEMKTMQCMKDKYDDAFNNINTEKQRIKVFLKDLVQIEQKLDVIINIVYNAIEELDVIALKSNVLFEDDYMDALIQSEETEQRQGWRQRITELKEFKHKQNALSEVMNGRYNPWNHYKDVENFIVTNANLMNANHSCKSNKKWASFVV